MTIRRILLLTVGLLAGLGLLLWLLQPIHVGNVTISFGLTAEAEAVLDELGVPDSAVDVSGVAVTGPDGPMPEIARRTFTVDSAAADRLPAFYRDQCRALGLGEPGEDRLAVMPTTLCAGRVDSHSAFVMLASDCAAERCHIGVSVHILPF
jgi:hypothetical protein